MNEETNHPPAALPETQVDKSAQTATEETETEAPPTEEEKETPPPEEAATEEESPHAK